MDGNTIIVYLACIIFLFIIGRFFILPLKSIAKLVGNSILGGIFILFMNTIGSLFQFHIGLNVGTAIITGILGIPRSNFISYFKNMDWIIKNKLNLMNNNFTILAYYGIIKGADYVR